MSKLYLELLDSKRKEVFLKLATFKKLGVLGGGTAISLQLGHRRSFDFDLLLTAPIKKTLLRDVANHFSANRVEPQVDTIDELTVVLDKEVKLTFLHFPFKSLHAEVKTEGLSLANVKDLASNKAYAIGRRGTWRDYVDLYFLIKNGKLSLMKIIEEAKKRFGGNFSERLFLEQLTYFGDIDDFTIDFAKETIPTDKIKNFLEREVRTIL